jgi:hypothetical protein
LDHLIFAAAMKNKLFTIFLHIFAVCQKLIAKA